MRTPRLVVSLVVFIALAAANVATAQNMLRTRPVPLGTNDSLRLTIFNASDVPLGPVSGSCGAAESNGTRFGSFTSGDADPTFGTSYGYGNSTGVAVLGYCDIEYGGPCDALLVSLCEIETNTNVIGACTQDGVRTCPEPTPTPREIATAAVKSARFARTHCAVTNVGSQPASAAAVMFDGNGAMVAAGQLDMNPGETRELVHQAFLASELWCRVSPATDASLRARIFTEGQTGGSVDGSPAR